MFEELGCITITNELITWAGSLGSAGVIGLFQIGKQIVKHIKNGYEQQIASLEKRFEEADERYEKLLNFYNQLVHKE